MLHLIRQRSLGIADGNDNAQRIVHNRIPKRRSLGPSIGGFSLDSPAPRGRIARCGT